MSKYDDELIIKLKKQGLSWTEIGDIIKVDGETLRSYSRTKSWYKEIKLGGVEKVVSKKHNSDGSISSMIRDRLDEKRQFSEEELLELHGFNPDEFRIKTVTSNEWSMTNSEGERYYNFQSKIIAELLRSEDKLIEQLEKLITKYTKPFELEKNVTIKQNLIDKSIVIPLPDMHFGLNICKDYSDYQEQIFDRVSKSYKTIVINILGDWLHTDNFVHETVSGTRVNDTNIPMAWEEASKFIEPLIQRALLTTSDVRIIYSKGNHDESMTWGFCKYLEVKYPQAKVDVTTNQLKVTVVGDMAIYFSHGHKQKNKLNTLCASLYPKEWGKATSRILLTGHMHHIASKDFSGIVQYQLPTISRSTDFEEDNLYLGSDKGIHLFEISNNRVAAIYYL